MTFGLRWLLLLLLLLLGAGLTACAAEGPGYTRFCASCGVWGADTFSSQSGQFLVHGRSAPRANPVSMNTNSLPLLQLEPPLLAVTADRIKRAFLQALGANDAYRDKIHFIILDLASPQHPISLVSRIFADGFQYQAGLPGQLETSRLVRTVVQSLLLDYANRGGRRVAELPPWLIEGMTLHVQSDVAPSLVMNRDPLTTERFGYDRLGATRQFLQTNSPMSIQELSFTRLPEASALDRARFENSAHLLVHELLRLQGGRALLGRFIQALPRSLNWQTAFFEVFRGHFQTPLDFEKWWALSWVNFRHHQERELWPLPLSLQKIDSLLLTPLEWRQDTNAIPAAREATLQEVLSQLEPAAQRAILAHKSQLLAFASLSLDPDAALLASAYREMLDSYLQKRFLGEGQPGLKSDPIQRQQALVKSALNSLDQLDRVRSDLKSGRKPNWPKRARSLTIR